MDSKETKNKKSKRRAKLSPLVQSIINDWETASDEDISDVLGSYTGNPPDGDYPQQDADDL